MSSSVLALVGAEIFVGGSMSRGDVVIIDGRIDSCGAGIPLPVGAEAIDVTGMTILPGLIDAHTHLSLGAAGHGHSEARLAYESVRRAEAFLRSGVTSVRDVGGTHNIDIELRNAIAGGIVNGPTMQCSGQAIVTTGGHGHMFHRVADGVDEVLKATRQQLQAGADLIKVMCSGGVFEPSESEKWLQFTDDELSVAIDEARKRARPVAAHAHPAEAIKRAVRLGVSTIEHGSYVDDEAADLMAERGVPLIPTFVVYKVLSEHPEFPGLHARARQVYESKFDHFVRAIARGMPWGVGSDYAAMFSEPSNLVDEVEILVKVAGLSSGDVLTAATEGNAKLMGVDDRTGAIAPGYVADLIVLDGNPVEDITALRKISATVKGGVVHKWKELTAESR
ncbi:amidohydrolase family protein [Dactylosporangium sp. CA-233914]|uniref:metal-dependent hydrolase family protein n=1 Tax=Dactylosporangium sp. CA-233914 TaxID=3239934 RepID=UPI003D8B3C47